MKNLITRVAAASAVAALFAACQHGDPVSNAGGPTGAASLVSGSPSGALLPAGQSLVIVPFDSSVKDAFSRRGDAIHSRFWNPDGDNGFWFWSNSQARNGTSARLDPRYPAIWDSSTAGVGGGLYLFAPGSSEGDYWEFYTGGFSNLKKNTLYTVVMTHERLKAAGQLDAAEKMLTGSVTQPDTLVLTGGHLDSIPLGPRASNWTGDAPAGCASFPSATANPFIVAREESDASGSLALDKCWVGNGSDIYTAANFNDQTKSIVGTDNDQPYGLPNYNYIEVWEGDYGTGTLVLRLQIAQDLSPAGVAYNNAFPPFPAPKMSSGALADKSPFPLPTDVLAQLRGGQPTPISTTLTLENLQALSGGAVYTVWYYNPANQHAVKANGTYVRKSGGTTADSAADVSSFTGGPGTITFTAPSYLADVGSYSDTLKYLIVTQESSAGATTPSASRLLWAGEWNLRPALPAGGTLTFGNFDSGTVFLPQGSATGGVLGDTTSVLVTENVGGKPTQVLEKQFVGSKIEMQFSGLMRPPVGYKYEGYLHNKTTGALTDLGGLYTPSGVSLDSADVMGNSPYLSSSMIVSSKLVADVHDLGSGGVTDQICNYDRFELFLVPKSGAVSSPISAIFNIALPDRVLNAASCR